MNAGDPHWSTRWARGVIVGLWRTRRRTWWIIPAQWLLVRQADMRAALAFLTLWSVILTAATWPWLFGGALRLGLVREPLQWWWRRVLDDSSCPIEPDVMWANRERTRLHVRARVGTGSLDPLARSARNLSATLAAPVTVWVRDDAPGEGTVTIGREPGALELATDWTFPLDELTSGRSLATGTVLLGRTDNGELRVRLRGQHLLVAGMTGSGKTTTLRMILAATVHDPIAQLWAANLKGDLGRWQPYAHRWATAPADVTAMLRELEGEARRRSDFLAQTGLEVMPCTGLWPLIVVALDEFPRWLSREGRAAVALLEDALALYRALGIVIVLTAQYPTVQAFGSNQIRANITTSIVHRCHGSTESRVALDVERDVADASELPGPGWAYVRTSGAPVLARSFEIDTAGALAGVPSVAPGRSTAPIAQPEPPAGATDAAGPAGSDIPADDHPDMSAPNGQLQGPQPPADTPDMSDDGPFDWAGTVATLAPLRLTSADAEILEALDLHPALNQRELADATGRDERTIGRRVKVLREAGLIAQRAGRWERVQ